MLALSGVTLAAVLETLLQIDPAWIPWLGLSLLIIIVVFAILLLADRRPDQAAPSELADGLFRDILRDARLHASFAFAACTLSAVVGILLPILVRFGWPAGNGREISALIMEIPIVLFGYVSFEAYQGRRLAVQQISMFLLLIRELERFPNDSERYRQLFDRVVETYTSSAAKRSDAPARR